MSLQLTPEIQQIVDRHVESGEFASREAVLMSALATLEQRADDLAAIRAGIADMKAGRVTPHDEVMRDMERRHPELRKP